MNPLVSVIVPVFNGERYLARALTSIVQQTYLPLEVIVVDDGSTDGSREIVDQFPGVRCECQTNRGVAVARNTGVALSTGAFLSFLDQDDAWDKDKTRLQMEFLFTHPDAMAVLCALVNVQEANAPPPPATADCAPGEASLLALGALLARRAVFERVGAFDSRFIVGSDFDWFVRAKQDSVTPDLMPDVLLTRYLHANNESRQVERKKSEYLQVLRAALVRKRRSGKSDA